MLGRLGTAGNRELEALLDAELGPLGGDEAGEEGVAGLVSAKRAQLGIEESLAFAVACGAESTQHLGAGALDPGEVARLVDKVTVRTLESPLSVG